MISGVECKVHYFVLDLPHSDGCFVKADPAETTEAFLDGHVSAFAFLGGVPQSILYDNTRLAVARTLHKSLGDGRRKRTRSFTELQSHHLFEDRFGRPGKGNDKGKVERMVGYLRRNFLVPAPRMESFEALNAHLERSCLGRMDARLRGHDETIGQAQVPTYLISDLTLTRQLLPIQRPMPVAHFQLRTWLSLSQSKKKYRRTTFDSAKEN